ncbi:restriction endonuclease subunit S [Armatimonas sp.]|uniref:restriction endonuclease subunit S n=1 Tax=Armatimonas sp. TaxID=1872638 RepID=UPI00286BFBD5|nr:restriction endonuclease subunit S [Armatimonas sp.]
MSTKKVPLSSLADYINGYAFKPDDFTDTGLPVIRIEQLKNRGAVCDLYNGAIPTKNYIRNGDLIFSWSASLFLQIWDRGPALLNQHLFRVIPRTGVDSTFLKYRIEASLPDLVNAAHGSTMQHITRKELDKCIVSIPIREIEQRKVAEIIATVDRATEQAESLIAKYQRVKTGLMQDLLTRGIDEHGNLRSEATHKFKDSPLGRIPVEWKSVPLSQIAIRITSGSRGWAAFYSDEGALFIRIGNLTRRHVHLRWDDVQYVKPPESSEGQRTSLEHGDLLISITADLGIIGVVPEGIGEAYINQHIALVKLDRERVNPWFVGNLLAGENAQNWISQLNESGAKAGLNLPTVASLPILLPPIQEQNLIVETFQKTERRLVSEQKQLEKLKVLKTGLMQDLLTGRIPVEPLLETGV